MIEDLTSIGYTQRIPHPADRDILIKEHTTQANLEIYTDASIKNNDKYTATMIWQETKRIKINTVCDINH